MSRIKDKIVYCNENSASIIKFETTGGGDWSVWNRYISIDGEKAYHIGNICGTCSFFFERMEGANKSISPELISSEFEKGLKDLDINLIKQVAEIIPDGKYAISLFETVPKLVEIGSKNDYFCNEQLDNWGMDRFWGFPHHPRIKYYRGSDEKLDKSKLLFEFIVPMFPQIWLDDSTVENYREKIKDNIIPTALALTVLDVKELCGTTSYDSKSHWCLAHYLLDGHHKVYAASLENKPISIMSFFALDHGISTEEEIQELLAKISL